MAIEKEVVIEDLPNGHRKVRFEKTDRDGTTVRIDHVVIEPLYTKTLLTQLKSDSHIEVKFCVREDEETEHHGDAEQWEVVLFPMFDRHGDEVAHGTVVDFDDSIVNGNLTVENGLVTDMSSNHLDPDYRAFQLPILYFARVWLQNYIREMES